MDRAAVSSVEDHAPGNLCPALAGEARLPLEADLPLDATQPGGHVQALAAFRQHAQVEVDHVPAHHDVRVELADASHDSRQEKALVGMVPRALHGRLGDQVDLLDTAAHQGGREDPARIGGGLEIDGEGAKGGARPRGGVEFGVAEAQQTPLEDLVGAFDGDRSANSPVDQVSIDEANVPLEDFAAALEQPVPDVGDGRRKPCGHPHHLATSQVPELSRLDADVALGGEGSLLLLWDEEVRLEAVVLHQEGLSAFQAAEELHDGSVFPEAVGGLHDEPGMHGLPTQRRGPRPRFPLCSSSASISPSRPGTAASEPMTAPMRSRVSSVIFPIVARARRPIGVRVENCTKESRLRRGRVCRARASSARSDTLQISQVFSPPSAARVGGKPVFGVSGSLRLAADRIARNEWSDIE